jgi:hypothetical protein
VVEEVMFEREVVSWNLTGHKTHEFGSKMVKNKGDEIGIGIGIGLRSFKFESHQPTSILDILEEDSSHGSTECSTPMP